MIVVTGGAGFIGSAFIAKLNAEGIDDIVVVDELGTSDKWRNLVKRRYSDYIHKDAFLGMIGAEPAAGGDSGISSNSRSASGLRKRTKGSRPASHGDRDLPFPVEAIIHMGACSSTTERDADFLMENNFHYTCRLAEWAIGRGVRFIYASSAATYGDGVLGFSDDDECSPNLRPINMYGYSKQLFDTKVIREGLSDRMAGIKFFNVFGPNEYHKGDMTSVIFKAFHQIRDTGRVRLFKSYKSEYPDGGQMRDFVYVKECVDVLWWLLKNREVNGIFNLGTGRARTWNDLIGAVFAALGLQPNIEYIEMPETIRNQYQYFTEAKMEKLRRTGCPAAFRPLEETVADYVKSHLLAADPYL